MLATWEREGFSQAFVFALLYSVNNSLKKRDIFCKITLYVRFMNHETDAVWASHRTTIQVFNA